VKNYEISWQPTGSRQRRPARKREEPEYHRLVAFDKLAETCNRYLRKGRKIYARGRLQYHTYTGQDSVERTGVEIVLEKMEMLDSMPQDVKETLNGTAVQQV
jgi:single-strand DNA-binding protein